MKYSIGTFGCFFVNKNILGKSSLVNNAQFEKKVIVYKNIILLNNGIIIN